MHFFTHLFSRLITEFPALGRGMIKVRHPFFLLVLCFSLLSLLMVFFRMQRVELDYQYHTLNKEIEKSFTQGKELKAKKAQVLSVKSLSEMAQKYDLEHPSEKQIIIIP